MINFDITPPTSSADQVPNLHRSARPAGRHGQPDRDTTLGWSTTTQQLQIAIEPRAMLAAAAAAAAAQGVRLEVPS